MDPGPIQNCVVALQLCIMGSAKIVYLFDRHNIIVAPIIVDKDLESLAGNGVEQVAANDRVPVLVNVDVHVDGSQRFAGGIKQFEGK